MDHLSSEFRRALRRSVEKIIPETEFNDRDLFRQFKREISRACNDWEDVPDQYVEK